YLNNRGSEEATYRISIVNRRMLENGHIVTADSAWSDECFAAEYIRFSPRRVVVPPQGNQAVRLTLRFPPGEALPDGEYRSHLMFRAVPNLPDPTTLDDDGEGIRVTAVAIIETTIPVIVRRGSPQATIAFGAPELAPNDPQVGKSLLTVPLLREGNRSVYGDLTVVYESPLGEDMEILQMRGMAVYCPTPRRLLRLPLDLPDSYRRSGGQLRVCYRETAAGQGDQVAVLSVPLD
ncbi:MAG: hypothetical protein ABIF77_03080, partial [bacterium]